VKYLFDTNVISEYRKKARMNPVFRNWIAGIDQSDVALSVLVLGEVRRGIEAVRHRDPVTAVELDQWLSTLEVVYAARILPIDARIADLWGRLQGTNPLSPVDGLIAATALVHGLTLVTRNVRDVHATGIPCLNPFEP
jgi:predicted nucleic acid-binding protein